jgi:hypothetical protein
MTLGPKIRHHTRPWIHPKMPKTMRRKLDLAFDVAAQRVSEVPRCASEFSVLGADGVQMLESTLYFAANAYKETTRCSTSAAYTFVGDAPTFLCRRFAFLSDEQAATILIHEALHHAGLSEDKIDPDAMPGYAINELVRNSCGL